MFIKFRRNIGFCPELPWNLALRKRVLHITQLFVFFHSYGYWWDPLRKNEVSMFLIVAPVWSLGDWICLTHLSLRDGIYSLPLKSRQTCNCFNL